MIYKDNLEMAFNAKTFDLTSRLHLVETWERLGRAFAARDGRTLYIATGTKAAAVGLVSNLYRVRAALRAQAGTTDYEHIVLRPKRTPLNADTGRPEGWAVVATERAGTRVVITDDAGQAVD